MKYLDKFYVSNQNVLRNPSIAYVIARNIKTDIDKWYFHPTHFAQRQAEAKIVYYKNPKLSDADRKARLAEAELELAQLTKDLKKVTEKQKADYYASRPPFTLKNLYIDKKSLGDSIIPAIQIKGILYYNSRLFQGLRVVEVLSDDNIDEMYVEEAFITKHIDKLNDLRLFYTSPEILALQMEISQMERRKWQAGVNQEQVEAEIALKIQEITDKRNKMEADKHAFLISALHKRGLGGGGRQKGGASFIRSLLKSRPYNDDEDEDAGAGAGDAGAGAEDAGAGAEDAEDEGAAEIDDEYKVVDEPDTMSKEFLEGVNEINKKTIYSEDINIVFSKRIKMTNKSETAQTHLYFNPTQYLGLIKDILENKWETSSKTNEPPKDLNRLLAEGDETFAAKLKSAGPIISYEPKVLKGVLPKNFQKQHPVCFALSSILNVIYMYNLTVEQKAEFRKLEEAFLNYTPVLQISEHNVIRIAILRLVNLFYKGDVCTAVFETDFEQDKIFFIKSTINQNDIGYSMYERTNILYLGEIYSNLKEGGKNVLRFFASHPRGVGLLGGAAVGAGAGMFLGPAGSLLGAALGAAVGAVAGLGTGAAVAPSTKTKEDLAKEEKARGIEQRLQEYLAVQNITPIQYLISRMDYIGAADISEFKNKDAGSFEFNLAKLTSRAYEPQFMNSAIDLVAVNSLIVPFITKSCMIPHAVYDFFYQDEKWKRLPVHAALTAIFSNPSRTLSLSYLKKSSATMDILNDLVAFAKENMQYMSGYAKVDTMYFTDQATFLRDDGITTGIEPVGEGIFDISKYENPYEVERENLINFNINPNLIIPAMKDFPSTYNKPLGNLLLEYETDRENFLESRKWKDKSITEPPKKGYLW